MLLENSGNLWNVVCPWKYSDVFMHGVVVFHNLATPSIKNLIWIGKEVGRYCNWAKIYNQSLNFDKIKEHSEDIVVGAH